MRQIYYPNLKKVFQYNEFRILIKWNVSLQKFIARCYEQKKRGQYSGMIWDNGRELYDKSTLKVKNVRDEENAAVKHIRSCLLPLIGTKGHAEHGAVYWNFDEAKKLFDL